MFGRLALMVLCGGVALGAAADTAFRAVELRCEQLVNPLAVDARTPRLSWKVEGDRRGLAQSAYRILVASQPEVTEQNADLWDSGKVDSDESVLIPYAGKPLASRQQCWWKVRAWDERGEAGPWSETASWAMGLLEPGDWKGAYIGLAEKDGDPEFPWLRKAFDLDAVPACARVYVNSLGYYELYVNGQKADDYVLAPAVCQFSKRSFYLVHDVTALLQPGKNVIAIALGRGWYTEGLPGVVYKGPLVRAQLELGGANIIATGADWKAHQGDRSRIGTWHSGEYGGERLDAARAVPGWNAPGFDDAGWPNAAAVEVPAHTVSAQPVEPNRIQRTFAPVAITPFGKKDWLIDFGTNLSGLFEMRLHGLRPKQKVFFIFGDRVDGDELDDFSQRSEYFTGEGDSGTFRNLFNYHAFRYVQIKGLEAKPDAADASAYLVRTDYTDNATFACSNTLLTDIHNMLHYTLECLSLGGYLVDCPHIERLGYGGDGQASTPTAMTMFGLGPLYTAWLGHWRDCQQPNGDMPHTAPNPYSAGGGPYWCGFIIAASWEAYVQYGDKRELEVNYPAMQLWLDQWVAAHTKDNVLNRWEPTEWRNWYLGDWARPNRTDEKAQRSVDLVSNCFRIQCLDWMEKIATVLGKPEDAARYAALAEAARPAVQAAFYDAARETYADDTQLDLAYPLMERVTPENLRPAILDRLEKDILVKHEGHLDVGLAGVPLLTRALMEMDRNDLVFSYVNQTTFPGWGYMLANGATTTWEHWDADRSHIHNCYNGVGMWFYRALAGIQPDPGAPGFKHFVLRPVVVGDVTWVKAEQNTVRGLIASAWRIENGRFVWEIQVPPNTTATIEPPVADAASIEESGKPVTECAGIKVGEPANGRAVVAVPAGQYVFSMPWGK